MPPTRRRSGNATPANQNGGAQHTLNFGNKSRVSKPTSRQVSDSKKEKLPTKTDIVSSVTSSAAASRASPAVHDVEDRKTEQQPTAASSRSENVIREQSKVELQVPKSEDDVRAEKLTDAEIRKYWEAEENKRIAPRGEGLAANMRLSVGFLVHQQELSVNEKVLRHFDLCGQYGPCMGIARIKRWRRANKLDLHPPIEVLAVLLKEEKKGIANEKAYVDELMS